MNSAHCDQLVARREAAQLLSISERTFDRLLKSGALPPPDVRVNGRARWWRANLLAWLAGTRESVRQM